jgi:hypothetical protein
MNDPEFLKALELVAEYDRQRPTIIKQFRLYYHEDGSIIGLWESDFPADGNYIVLEDPNEFHRHSTPALRVKEGKLVVLDLRQPIYGGVRKSDAGQSVVKNKASIALGPNDKYSNVEHYGRKTNH